jgi:hypothetical protein
MLSPWRRGRDHSFRLIDLVNRAAHESHVWVFRQLLNATLEQQRQKEVVSMQKRK